MSLSLARDALLPREGGGGGETAGQTSSADLPGIIATVLRTGKALLLSEGAALERSEKAETTAAAEVVISSAVNEF